MTDGAPEPTHEQIIRAVSTTGFMFEQKIADLLGAGTVTGWAFKDQDSGISREVDIFKQGYVHAFVDDRSVDLEWIILGECKNYQWPWVVLERPWEGRPDRFGLTGIHMTLSAKIALGADDFYALARDKDFFARYHDWRFAPHRRGVQLLKLNKKSGGWEANSNDIFNDITYPLAKAVNHWNERLSEWDKGGDRPPLRRVTLIFPAIFVSSALYAVAGGVDDAVVNRIDHVIVERSLKSETVSGKYRFDVVHVNHARGWHNEYVLNIVKSIASALCFQPEDLLKIDQEVV
ncbi:hypothetical protein [Kutzneria albida]|nr:hypothetical protein [Kutzneria albida]